MDRDRNQWKEIQKRAFTNWFNDRLRGNLKVAKQQVHDLKTDLKDGILIITLLENLAKPRKVGRYSRNPTNKLHCIENIGASLRFTKSENIKLVNIGPEDIYDENLKLIMGFVWTLISHYQIRSSGRGLSTKQAMKEWLNALIPEYEIQNFTTNWNDGRALCGLVDRLKPGLCPNHFTMDPKQALDNCRLGMELAKTHFGIPAILDPEDLRNPDVDDLSVMTYVSYFFEPALKQLLEWIQQKIPKQKVTNLSTDWNDGVNLAALMEACHKGIFPHWKDLDPHNSLPNVKECIETAKRRLDIECPVAPSVLTDPKVDEIVMATYLSRFKYSKLLAKPDELCVVPPDLPYCRVNMPVEFDVDLGPDPMSVINDVEVTVSGPTTPEVDLTTKDKTTVALFVPTKTGEYEVNCLLNGKDIEKSPFTVVVIDPKQWEIAADPPKFLNVGKLVRLPVKGPSGIADIPVTCEVEDMHGDPASFVNGSVSPGTDNNSSVILEPTAVGKAMIGIKVLDTDVKKSPFTVKVCDPSLCKVDGLGTGKGRVHEPVSFDLSAADAGDDKPAVTVKGPFATQKPKLKNKGDGEYEVTFTPDEPGDHKIDIAFGGEPIPGSPFHKYVDDLPDSDSCSATGQGLTEAVVLEPAYFTIITPEKGLLNKPDILSVNITSGPYEAEVKMEEKRGGAYLVTYIAPKEGKYTIDMDFYGNKIPGCPYMADVRPRSDAGKCRAYGPALNPKAVLVQGQPMEFYVDTKKAGTENLQVDAQDPNKENANPHVSDDEGIYTVKLQPASAGEYLVDVRWGEEQIPGSPFRLNVQPGSDASKCRVYGPALHPNALLIQKRPLDFYIDAKNAGLGKLQVEALGPDNTEAKVFIANDEGIYSLKVDPPVAGWYRISVWWSKRQVPGSPFKLRVHPKADASKVKAYGPGLGPTIEVGKTSQFIIETRNAGIGTLSVLVHGIKNAFKVEVFPEDETDPRTLTAQYNPTQGGDYSVTIKWSGVEIPGCPFAVSVVDLEYEKQLAAERERERVERQELAKRKAQSDFYRRKQQEWLRAQTTAQAAIADRYNGHVEVMPQFVGAGPAVGLMAAPRGGMVTTQHVRKVQKKKMHKSSKSALDIISSKKKLSGSSSLRPRMSSAPPTSVDKFASAGKRSSLTTAIQNNAEAMINQQMEERYGPSSPNSVPFAASPRPVSTAQEGFPDEVPVTYAPIYMATGEMPSKKTSAKRVEKKKKKKAWRY